MATAMSAAPGIDLPTLVDAIRPKEHGSWSLVLEPIVLGLLIAPTEPGFALAVAILAAFFARRPLRLIATENDLARRRVAVRALAACGGVALAGFVLAVALMPTAWCVWLVPTAVGGAAFLYFDLRRAGREQAAEIAGSCAFAWLPAVFATLGGFVPLFAIVAAVVMLARALPTVLVVRATIRARKANRSPGVWPVIAAALAVVPIVGLVRIDAVPTVAIVAVGVLATRAVLLLVAPRPALRASTIGMIEALLGAAYVITVGLAW